MSDLVVLANEVRALRRRLERLETQEQGSGGGVTDHGALTGLGDDDHTIYLLASGARAANRLAVGTGAIAAGTYYADLLAATGASRDILRAGLSGGSSGLTVQYNGAAMLYTLADGNVGINAAPQATGAADYLINTSKTFTDATAGAVRRAISGSAAWNAAGSITQYVQALFFQAQTVGGATGSNAGYMKAAQIELTHRSNGTLTTAYGLDVEAGTYNGGSDSTGTISTLYGIYIGGYKTASSTISNNYGLYVAALPGTNAWSIYTGATPSYFGGRVDIRQASATAAIAAMTLTQDDLSEEFIEFDGTVAAGNPIDTAAVGTYYGKVRVSVNGTFKYLPLYNS